MKKALFAIVLLGAVTASADDSFLYWMVGDDVTINANTTAKVKDTASGEYLTIWDEWGDVSYGESVGQSTIQSTKEAGETFSASLAGVSTGNSSWIVELWEDNHVVSATGAQPYSSAYVGNGLGGLGGSTPALLPASAFAVPEPSSGLLMLFGCAMLGLRRRKQKTA